MTVFKNLRTLHDKFGISAHRLPKPGLLDLAHMEFRLSFLDEELDETKKAFTEGDLEEVIDGLIDLMYVAAGTLDLMGVSSQDHWAEVHRANMNKRRVTDASTSKRGFTVDLEKPEGWTKPNHVKILKQRS